MPTLYGCAGSDQGQDIEPKMHIPQCMPMQNYQMLRSHHDIAAHMQGHKYAVMRARLTEPIAKQLFLDIEDVGGVSNFLVCACIPLTQRHQQWFPWWTTYAAVRRNKNGLYGVKDGAFKTASSTLDSQLTNPHTLLPLSAWPPQTFLFALIDTAHDQLKSCSWNREIINRFDCHLKWLWTIKSCICGRTYVSKKPSNPTP